MRHNRDIVQRFIGLSEGGYVNHPKDPGGATDRGITQATYNAHLKRKGLPPASVRGISKSVAEEIIFGQYMRPVRFDELSDGLDYAMADYAVNSGPSRAVKELQRIVGVRDDGVMGDITMAAVQSKDQVALITELCDRRMAFLRRLKTWSTFGKGWSIRVVGNQAGFQANDIGVLDRAIMMNRGAAQASIPAPTEAAPGKADQRDVSNTSALETLASDPLAAIPAFAGLAPLLNGVGPVQIALAAVIVLVTAYVLFERIKKDRRNA
jgi:lysozyme family protein